MIQTSSLSRFFPKYLYASLLLLLAVILQCLYHYQFQDAEQTGEPVSSIISLDVDSAVRRAKTQECRQEFHNFAQRNRFNGVITEYLERSCPLDSKSVERITRLGCSNSTAPSANQSHYVTLEDYQTDSLNLCGELCFSFGHAYAARKLKSKICYCFNTNLTNVGELGSCSAENQLEWSRVDNGIHYPSAKKPLSLGTDVQRTDLRIAFLLSLNGRSILQIRRLLKSIYSQRHIYYIHIDMKAHYLFEKLEHLEREIKNIHFSSRRLDTIWGGTALLSMMINTMEDLKDYRWDYLINLSESDFPLRSLHELETYLSIHSRQSIYLKSHNTKGYNFVKKQGLNFDFYQCEGRVWRLGKRSLPRGLVYTGGSDWFALPKEFCDHIVKNRNSPGSLVNSLLQIFNFTLLPAESFFHTLAQNGEFCDRLVDNNLRVTNWHRKQDCKCQHKDVVDWCGCSPSIYRWPDRNRLKQVTSNPSLFFSRKFDPTVSNSIIGFVEAHLINRFPHVTQIGTAYWLNVFDSGLEALPDVFSDFAIFVKSQIGQRQLDILHLKSINLFFNQDRFVGYVFEYYQMNNSNIEVLVSSREDARLISVDENCFQADLKLKSIQVDQDFDTGERLFRNRTPLNSMSNIVVHHEWVVQNEGYGAFPDYRDVQFKWINPDGETELLQDARLKISRRLNRLSLVHRLHKRRPYRSGLWKLKLLNRQRNCLEYQFLVFNETSFSRDIPSRDQFARFYQVTRGCSTLNNSSSCPFSWSLYSRDMLLSQYSL